MRKAGKQRIKIATAELQQWLTKHDIENRIAKIPCRIARKTVQQWLDKMRTDIAEGQFSKGDPFIMATGASIKRTLENFEEGYYVKGTKTGGFECKPYRYSS